MAVSVIASDWCLGSELPYTFASGVGSNRCATVVVSNRTTSATAVTFGGQGMTQVGSEISIGADHKQSLWRLVNAPTGNQNIDVTGNDGGSSSIGFVVFGGVDQTTPVGTLQTNSGSTANPTLNISGTVDDMAIGGCADAQSLTMTTGTMVWGGASSPSKNGGYQSGGATMSFAWTAIAGDWTVIGVAVKAVGGATPRTIPAHIVVGNLRW